MAKLFNLARVTTATTGTGTITLGSAASGHLTFANAGVTDGQYVTYGIIDGTESEVGRGLYTSSGTTLTRSVITSTNSNSAINLSGTAEVFITSINSDFNALPNTSGQYNVLLAAGTNVTADRTLTLTTGDANRTLDISAGSVTISTAGANLIDDADASAQRTTLGLGTMALETAASYSTTAAIAAAYQPLDAQLTDVAGLAVTDGNFIVGNGTNFVAESGNTARTSLGLGTSDSPEFTAVSIDDADTTITRVSAGLIAVEGDTVALLNASQTLANKTLTAPALGTPASGTLTNCTGLPVATGISGLGSNVATFLATPSSANLASALTDETGSGAAVFGTAPTITNSLTVTSTDAGTGAAPDLVLWRNSASPADNDILGQIKFDGEDSAGNQQTYGTISGQILDEASTSEDGSLLFGVTTAGSLANELVLYGTSLSPVTTDGLALGTSSLMWSDLHLASGGVINWANGEVLLSASASYLALTGVTGFSCDGQIVSSVNGALAELRTDRSDNHGVGFIGAMYFDGKDNANAFHRYNQIQAHVDDATAASEDSHLRFLTTSAGASTNSFFAYGGSIRPGTNDGSSLGISGTAWSDLFLASGGTLNFNNDVVLTHSTGVLAMDGVFIVSDNGAAPAVGSNAPLTVYRSTGDAHLLLYSNGQNIGGLASDGSGIYLSTESTRDVIFKNGVTSTGDHTATGTELARFTSSALRPGTNDQLALGTSTVGWADLHLASGGVINFNNSDITLTHSADSLALDGGTLYINGGFKLNQQGGAEGGEMVFRIPASGTTLSGDVYMDIYGDTLRIFEGNSPYSGVSFNIASTQPGGGQATIYPNQTSTVIATTSGTSKDFTNIPSWATGINVIFRGVSTNGTNGIIIQLGTGGTPTTSGYNSVCAKQDGTLANNTAGLIVVNDNLAANDYSGVMTLRKITGNTWVSSGVFRSSTGGMRYFAGDIAVGGALDMIRLTTTTGVNTFDAGDINIAWW